MTTTTNTSTGPLTGERIVIAAAAAVIGGLIGSLLLPGPGTALRAKLGALLSGGRS